MTEADLEVLSRFEAVWARVMTGNEPEAKPQQADWEELLQGLYTHWRGCYLLGRRAAGTERYRLFRLAQEAKEVFDRLQTEYFLETGDIFLTRETANFASYTPCNLRKLWKSAMNLARDLQNAPDGENSLFETAGERLVGQGDVLKNLIYESLQ